MFINRAFILLSLVVSSFVGIFSGKNNVPTKNDVLEEEYEIYPLPHDIEYRNDVLNLKDNVYLTYTTNIDEATIDRCYDVLSLKDLKVYSEVSQIKGTYSRVNISTAKDITISDSLSYFDEKYDAYYLEIISNEINIIGKDTDATYYALASLEYIFNQTNNSRMIRQLIIRDYSDLKYRGFIEGFYGDPWSAEERENLMRFGSKNKNNIYIYAPKDDVYHSALWRELYDNKNLARLKEQIEEGRRTKTHLAWAIHPFINKPLKGSTFDSDMEDVLNKLEQVYQAGVRQFVISADDSEIDGVLNPDGTLAPDYKEKNLEYAKVQNKVLNRVAEWCKDKGDCYNLVFVPGAYCYDAETALYYFNCEYYYRGLIFGDDGDVSNCSTYLDESIEIMWTGNYVCSRLSGSKLDEFYELTDGRKPFIWMNWPVNDFSPTVIRLGPGEVYDEIYQDSDEAKISGLVTNLMLEVESSKVGLFATSDYCWNTRDYDKDQSYKDSFKYIEKNTPESLFEISQHLRNSVFQFDGAYFSEAPELVSLINEFNNERALGDMSNSISKLMSYFEKLEGSCDNFLANGSNKKLINEISAWVRSLRYGALCAINYLKVISNRYGYDEAMFYKKQASNLYELYKHQTIKSPNASTYSIKYIDVAPGAMVLDPFITTLDGLSNDVASLTGVKISLEKYPDSDTLGPGTDALRYLGVDGKMDYMVDGDLSTRAYFLFTDWLYAFQFDLIFDYGSSQEISSIDLIQGESDRLWCYIEYSNDGINYQAIPYVSAANKNISFISDDMNHGLIDGEMTDSGYYRAIANTHIELEEPINARYIKLKNYHTNCRVVIYELMLNEKSPTPRDIITFKGLTLKDNESINSLLEGHSVEFEPFVSDEMMIDYDLGEKKIIKNINFLMDSQYCLNEYEILVSQDGYNYYKYNNNLEEGVRYVRIYSSSKTDKKLIINKLEVIYD